MNSNQLFLYRQITTVSSQNHTEHKCTLSAERKISLVLNLMVHIATIYELLSVRPVA